MWYKRRKTAIIGVIGVVFLLVLAAGRTSTLHQKESEAFRRKAGSTADVSGITTETDSVAVNVEQKKAYADLETAVSEAQDSQTIALLKKCSVRQTITVSKKKITITSAGSAETDVTTSKVMVYNNTDNQSTLSVGDGGEVTLAGEVCWNGRPASSDTGEVQSTTAGMITLKGSSSSNLAKLNINDGVELKGHSAMAAGAKGGAVVAETYSEINMTGGTITDNHTAGNGGAIFLAANAKCNLQGGTITQNTAKNGGGIYVSDKAGVHVSGTVTVNNNTSTEGKNNDVSLNGTTNYIQVSNALEAGTNIGVTMPSGNAVGTFAQFDSDVTQEQKQTIVTYFHSNAGNYGTAVDTTGLGYFGYRVKFEKGAEGASWTAGKDPEEKVYEKDAKIISFPQAGYTGYFQAENAAWSVTDTTGKEQYIAASGTAEKYLNKCQCIDGTITIKANWSPLVATIKRSGAKYSQLADAFADAQNGDVISLQASEYAVPKTIEVKNKVTLEGNAKENTVTREKGIQLFKVTTGELKLQNITISGKELPGSLVCVSGGYLEMNENTTLCDVSFMDTKPSKATGYGAVYMTAGSMNLNGAELKENRSAGDGGAVYMDGGTFTVNKGVITGNTADNGAGIYVKTGSLNVRGGEIVSNQGTQDSSKGMGIYSNVDFNLEKNPKITENVRESTKNNVYLAKGKRIQIVGELTGEEETIGISMQDPTEGYFTNGLLKKGKGSGTAEKARKHFFSDQEVNASLGYAVGLQDNEAFLGCQIEWNPNNGVFADTNSSETRTMAVLINSKVTLPKIYRSGSGLKGWMYEYRGETHMLTADTIVSENMTVTAEWGEAVVRNTTNNHDYADFATAIADASAKDTLMPLKDMEISEPVSIDKSITIDGAINGDSSDRATVTLADAGQMFLVTATDAKNAPEVIFKNIKLDAASQSSSLITAKAGNVILDSGVEITGRQDKKEAAPSMEQNGLGAVCVNGGTVTMQPDSVISGNIATENGAGVYVAAGTFVMYGGEIRDNRAENAGGGVYVAKEAAFQMRGGSITGNTAATGAGVYVEGKMTLSGTETAKRACTITDNKDDNVYLANGVKLAFAAPALEESSKIAVTLQNPAQGVFTTGLGDNAQVNKNLLLENTGYAIAKNNDKEAYIGHSVIFHIAADEQEYFSDEESLSQEQRHDTREIVVIENQTVIPPGVRKGTQAVDGWYTNDYSEQLNEETQITKNMEVYAQWTDAVCHIGKDYYATLERAAFAAEYMDGAVTISLLQDCMLGKNIAIAKQVTITSETGSVHTIKRNKAVQMFRVEKQGKLIFSNIHLAGNDYDYAMIYVNGGCAVIQDGTIIKGCKNQLQAEKDADTGGPGTIYVKSGKLEMTGGSIQENSPARGGGVYLQGGVFSMSGGSITKNTLSDDVSIYGGGVYIEKGAAMNVSGSAVINENALTQGTTQNVYYTPQESIIHIDGALSKKGQIGVTPAVPPTGITSDTMIDVTDEMKNAELSTYVDSAIFADDDSCETVKDSDNNKIRMRYGHTVTFDAGKGTIQGTMGMADVVHNKTLTTLPKAVLKDSYFDGWYTQDDEPFTTQTVITKSMTVYARYTSGLCETPTVSPAAGTYYTDVQEVVLQSATEGARIYYTLDGTTPNAQATQYTQPIALSEDAQLKAIAVKDGWSDSAIVTAEYTICNVRKITINKVPKALYRGYSSQLTASIETGNTSTDKTITWKLVGSYQQGTTIDEKGKLTVDAAETAEEITVQACSADPDKTSTVKIPVKDQYQLTYDKNAPTGQAVTGSMADENSPYQAEEQVTVMKNAYACSGYTFAGWNTKADGSGTAYKQGDTFTITENTVLYAQWEVNIVISKVSVSPQKVQVTQGSQYAFKATVTATGNYTGEVTWTIKEQKSENTTIDENGTLHVDTNETAEKIVVTATSKENEMQWGSATVEVKQLTRYELQYMPTGGVGQMVDTNSPYIAGKEVLIRDCAFVRAGYDFVCWNTAANGKGAVVHPGDTYKITEDIILYAQWKRNDTYIEDDSTGGASDNPTPVSPKTDKEYAQETIALINAIGEVNEHSGSAIARARASYEALTQEQKAMVGESEYNKLLLAEMVYQSLTAQKTASGNSGATAATATTRTNNSSVVIGTTLKGLKVGKKFKKDAYWYQVTASSAKSKKVKLLKQVKKARRTQKTVVIPDTVMYRGITYKVTEIGADACRNNKRIRKITIGKNISVIGEKAFYGTAKCKAVTIRSAKIKQIGNKAFTGISKKAYIKMPDRCYRKYLLLIQKSGKPKGLRIKTY